MQSGRPAASLGCPVRDITSRADSGASTVGAGLKFFKSPFGIDISLAIASATLMSTVTFRTFSRPVFFKIQHPLFNNLVILSENGKFVPLTPGPSNCVKIETQGFSSLDFLSAEIEGLLTEFIKDGDISVNKYVTNNGGEIKSMVRYEVGEGMEHRNDNFAEEVMNQAKGN